MINSLGRVNFTGKLLVNGPSDQVDAVAGKIAKKAFYSEDGKLLLNKPDNFDVASVNHQADWSKKTKTNFFTTGVEASMLKRYFTAEKVARANNHRFDPNKFYSENLEKYIKLPETVVSAEEVLTAIKNGLFDFANLVIKK